MTNLLALVEQACVRSAKLNDELAQAFSIAPGEPPISSFNMVNQYTVVTLELLSFYNRTWSKLSASAVSDPDETKQENVERVRIITKAAFILSLSAFEFAAKQTLMKRPGKIPPIEGRVYLRKIIERSIAAGILPQADSEPWEGSIEVRNVLVHNNGIASRTATYKIPGGPTIMLTEGTMTQGNLKFFPEVLLWCIEGFGRWSEAYLR